MQEDSENFVKEISKLVDFVITGSLREDLDSRELTLKRKFLRMAIPLIVRSTSG